MRFAAFASLLLACGRLNFNESADAAIDGSSPSTDASPDARTTAVCGDGFCDGELGELCGMCMSDCAVTNAVCGNGQCDTAEDGTTCEADCGPATWPWPQDETDLLTAVNSARVGGVMCPGDASPRTAAVLSATTSMRIGTREMAWEIVHQKFTSSNGTSCNGRTFAEREQPYGGNGGLSVFGTVATATEAVNVWKTDATLCPILMTTSYSQASTGVAREGTNAFVIWFK